jgi:hypothetical protein
LLLDGANSDGKSRLNLEAVDVALNMLSAPDRTNFWYFVGHFLACRGDKKNAAVYLERCADAAEHNSDLFRALAAVELREHLQGAGKKP